MEQRFNLGWRQLKKILEAAAAGTVRKRVGRPPKQSAITQEQLNWLTLPSVLRTQAGFSLKMVLSSFNQRFAPNKLTAHDLREVYRGLGITFQKVRPRLGPKALPAEPQQRMRLRELAQEVGNAISHGYEIVQVDESLFNPDSFTHRHWAPVRNPHGRLSRFTAQPKIVACGAISAERGLVTIKYGERSFKSHHMIEMLQQIRDASRGKRICVFWDNATFHRTKAVKEFARRPEINIRLIYNVPYRADLNGIEHYWGLCKNLYRRSIVWMKVNNHPILNIGQTQSACERPTQDDVKRCAQRGLDSIGSAKPLKALPTEQLRPMDWEQYAKTHRDDDWYSNDPSVLSERSAMRASALADPKSKKQKTMF